MPVGAANPANGTATSSTLFPNPTIPPFVLTTSAETYSSVIGFPDAKGNAAPGPFAPCAP